MGHFSYKGGCGRRGRMCIEVFKGRAGLRRLHINGFVLLVIRVMLLKIVIALRN